MNTLAYVHSSSKYLKRNTWHKQFTWVITKKGTKSHPTRNPNCKDRIDPEQEKKWIIRWSTSERGDYRGAEIQRRRRRRRPDWVWARQVIRCVSSRALGKGESRWRRSRPRRQPHTTKSAIAMPLLSSSRSLFRSLRSSSSVLTWKNDYDLWFCVRRTRIYAVCLCRPVLTFYFLNIFNWWAFYGPIVDNVSDFIGRPTHSLPVKYKIVDNVSDFIRFCFAFMKTIYDINPLWTNTRFSVLSRVLFVLCIS